MTEVYVYMAKTYEECAELVFAYGEGKKSRSVELEVELLAAREAAAAARVEEL